MTNEELIIAYKQSNSNLYLDILLEQNDRFLRFICAKVNHTIVSVDSDDLLQFARIGFCKFVDKYDPFMENGANFIVYVYKRLYWYVSGQLRYKRKISEREGVSLEDLTGEGIISSGENIEQYIIDSVYTEQLKREINEVMLELTEKQRIAINSKFGLNGYPILSTKEFEENISGGRSELLSRAYTHFRKSKYAPTWKRDLYGIS